MPETQVLIHVGEHKTGTTSVQKFLALETTFAYYESHGVRIAHDLIYESPSMQTNSSEAMQLAFEKFERLVSNENLIATVRGASNLPPDVSDPLIAREARDNARTALEHLIHEKSRIVISAESVSQFEPAELKKMIEWFKARSCSVLLVLYKRDLLAYTLSATKMQIALGQDPFVMNRSYEGSFSRTLFPRVPLSFDHQTWDRHVPEDAKLLRFSYDEIKGQFGGGLIAHFHRTVTQAFGLPQGELATRTQEGLVNESTSHFASDMLLLRNREHAGLQPRDLYFGSERYDGPSFRIATRIAEVLQALCSFAPARPLWFTSTLSSWLTCTFETRGDPTAAASAQAFGQLPISSNELAMSDIGLQFYLLYQTSPLAAVKYCCDIIESPSASAHQILVALALYGFALDDDISGGRQCKLAPRKPKEAITRIRQADESHHVATFSRELESNAIRPGLMRLRQVLLL